MPTAKRRCVSVPPKIYYSVHTAGKQRPVRREVRGRQHNGSKSNLDGCQQTFACATFAGQDTSTILAAFNPDIPLDDQSEEPSETATATHESAWAQELQGQIDAFSELHWSSTEEHLLCYECWQQHASETHECVWQIASGKPRQGVFPLKMSTDSQYVHLNLPESHMLKCTCCHPVIRLTVFDHKARARNCRVQVCSGESRVVSLVRHGLWPATPLRPVKAMHISLMLLLYELVVGAQFSLYRSCKALQAFSRLHAQFLHTTDLYDAVNRFKSMRFFRRFMQAIHFMRDASSHSQSDRLNPLCPACPNEDGEMVVCMDACFGLVHKMRVAGNAQDDATNTRYICNGQDVADFVQSAGNADGDVSASDTKIGCSSFSAGDTVIAATKNKGLAVKGVFGSCCRHQLPLKFLDMKHGERFAYPTYMLRDLCASLSSDLKITVLYDVACKYSKNIERLHPQLAAKLSFKVPVFHSYAHSLACQLDYNPRVDGSVGLCDGEGQERLWAMLRLLSRSMKEMTSANRAAFLDDVLRHYAALTGATLGHWVEERFRFAKLVEQEAQSKLTDLLHSIGSTASVAQQENICNGWRKELQQILCKKRVMPSKQNEWQRNYVAKLTQLDILRKRINDATNAAEITKLQCDEAATIAVLESIEQQRRISSRWQCADIIFRTVQDQLRMEQLEPILMVLFRAASEKKNFSNVMKKFCPGQAAYAKIKQQITKRQTSLTSNLEKYNRAPKPVKPKMPEFLDEREICDPESPTWAQLQLLTQCGDIDPLFSLKLAGVFAFGRLKSAREEQRLLSADAGNIRNDRELKTQLLSELSFDTQQATNQRFPLYLWHLQNIQHKSDCDIPDYEAPFAMFCDSDSDSETEL